MARLEVGDMRNPRVLLMWAAIALLSGVLVLRVRNALSETRPDHQQASGAETQESGAASEEFRASELDLPNYDRGDCLTWDQGEGRVAAKVIDCSEPHLIEAVETVAIDRSSDTAFPTDAEWAAITAEHCDPVVADYLSRPLDPYGRLSVGVIRPQEEAWRLGSREILCGIQSVTIPNTGIPPGGQAEMTGRAADVDQSMLFPVGSCLDYSNDLSEVVPCTDPHHAVIVGHLDLSKLVDRPTDDSLRLRCAQLVATDQGMPGGTRNFLGFEAASWAAGSHMGNCTESIYDGNGAPTLQPGTS